jgi:predicted RecB family nuclease
MASGREIRIHPPDIEDHPNYVMFDLEGLPPQLDELDKVYLWGLQVFGRAPAPFQAATAGFGPDGDRLGWQAFLDLARDVFTQHGDVPFVHWHHYERVRLEAYVARFGNRDGLAARVHQNLLDLLPIAQSSIALPLPSYSLKLVEKYIGFRRTQEEYGGEWAMAKYIEATETEDEKARNAVMHQILAYNREDLEATWAVLQWLRAKRS